ncbi:MAG: hypothetical protein KAH93_03740 [Candidatus Aenigmarchaeota archaeon]|nr:hypothetical protein [Candidatus Aenigmarchaeota archaeon]
MINKTKIDNYGDDIMKDINLGDKITIDGQQHEVTKITYKANGDLYELKSDNEYDPNTLQTSDKDIGKYL